jgi:hypothetical protein
MVFLYHMRYFVIHHVLPHMNASVASSVKAGQRQLPSSARPSSLA